MLPTPKREREAPPRTEEQPNETTEEDISTTVITKKAKLEAAEQPNQTIYFNNLPDRLKKPFLRHQLYILGSAYGQLLDVVALKTPKMRGQAHLVYKELDHAVRARKELDGTPFFGKVIRARFAKGTSHKAAQFQKLVQEQRGKKFKK